MKFQINGKSIFFNYRELKITTTKNTSFKLAWDEISLHQESSSIKPVGNQSKLSLSLSRRDLTTSLTPLLLSPHPHISLWCSISILGDGKVCESRFPVYNITVAVAAASARASRQINRRRGAIADVSRHSRPSTYILSFSWCSIASYIHERKIEREI